MDKIIAVVSGGLDSVTMAYHFAFEGHEMSLISFDYGQRHRKELQFAARTAKDLGLPHRIIDLSGLLLKGSALTDDIPVPDGHYAEEMMKVTIVPNRNAIMLAIAFGIAVAEGYNAVAIAVHTGDHFIYPDCRPEFLGAFETMQHFAVDQSIKLLAPFVDFTKAQIVSIGASLSVPYQSTWSCYKGGEHHCGTCGTCVERKEAFDLSGVPDPTEYERKPHE